MKPMTRKEIVSALKAIEFDLHLNHQMYEQFDVINDQDLKRFMMTKNANERKELLRQLKNYTEALDRLESKKFFGLF